jgi:RepB plasmid partitioning protein/ParB/Sulfiredoxin domain
MAFKSKSALIKLTSLLPVKTYPDSVRKTRKYRQIKASVQEVGIIEPPTIYRTSGKRGQYLLLDGHLRIAVLKELGIEAVTCLIATDDEAFTYNKRISRLSTVQEHKMILRAIESGVSEDRIARSLDVNVASIRKKRRLLKGICPEVANLLKDKHCPMNTFRTLEKMKPMRQIEVTEMMIDMNNYSDSYSKALLVATPQDQLANSTRPKTFKGLSTEQVERMEREMAKLQLEMKSIEESYGPDHLNLVVARGYLANLLKNEKVTGYLTKHHSEVLDEFRKIVKMVSLEQAET